jgi:tetratricopeptide (TPR) repeat protein
VRIYLSRTAQDQAFCDQLAQALRAAGADVFYTEDPATTRLSDQIIERELRKRDVFIVILSPAALASAQVEDETRRFHAFLQRDVTLILLPVLAEPLSEADIWPFLLHLGRVEPSDASASAFSEAVARTLALLCLTPETPKETTPQPNESLHSLLTRGKALCILGRVAEGLEFFKQVTRSYPNSVEAWINLAATSVTIGDYDAEIVALDRALALDPQNATAWNQQGFAYGRAMMYAEQLNAYQQALAVDPTFVWAWNNMGNRYAAAGQYEEELKAFERSLTLDPNDPATWAGKGLALRDLKRYDEAIEAYERALELDPENDLAWHYKGTALLSLKRYEESSGAYYHALALNPHRPQTLMGLRMALDELRRIDEVEAEWLAQQQEE